MNNIYTVLVNKADISGEWYTRRMDSGLDFSPDPVMADILVSPSTDPGYIAFQANALCELCAESAYREELASLDPENTYDSHIQPPIESFKVIGNPSTVTVNPVDSMHTYPWTTLRFSVDVDTTSGKAVVEVPGETAREIELSEVGGVSRILEIKDGFGIWLGGLAPLDKFTLVMETIRKPFLDMNNLLATLQDRMPTYNGPDTPVDKVARVVLDHCAEALGI